MVTYMDLALVFFPGAATPLLCVSVNFLRCPVFGLTRFGVRRDLAKVVTDGCMMPPNQVSYALVLVLVHTYRTASLRTLLDRVIGDD